MIKHSVRFILVYDALGAKHGNFMAVGNLPSSLPRLEDFGLRSVVAAVHLLGPGLPFFNGIVLE